MPNFIRISFKKNLLKILSIIFMMNIVSCKTYESSPAIWLFNMSDDYITYVRGNWNGMRMAGHEAGDYSPLIPGAGGSENLIVSDPSQIFGPVHLQWYNAKGVLIQKDFTFTKDQLPNTKHHNFDHIYIFLTQDDMELFSRGQGKPSPRQKEMDKMRKKVKQLQREYKITCSKGTLKTSFAEALKNPNQSIAELKQKPMTLAECKKMMPIYQPKNIPRIEMLRKLEEAYELEKLEYGKRLLKEKNERESVKNKIEN